MDQEKDIVERLSELSSWLRDHRLEAPVGSRQDVKLAIREIERLRRELEGFYTRFARELALGQERGISEGFAGLPEKYQPNTLK